VCKKSITNSQPFVKKNEKMSGPLGGIFLTHTIDIAQVTIFGLLGQVNSHPESKVKTNENISH